MNFSASNQDKSLKNIGKTSLTRRALNLNKEKIIYSIVVLDRFQMSVCPFETVKKI